jgi:hypothetical protein
MKNGNLGSFPNDLNSLYYQLKIWKYEIFLDLWVLTTNEKLEAVNPGEEYG